MDFTDNGDLKIAVVTIEESVKIVSLIKELFNDNEWVEKHLDSAEALARLCEELSR